MPIYLQRGIIPKKRHTILPANPGFRQNGIYEGIHYEEVVTTAGFSRAYSIVYHLRPPTRVRKIESLTPESQGIRAEAPLRELRHYHLKTGKIAQEGDLLSGRIPVLQNNEVIISRCRPKVQMRELFRNASADELIFVHRGSGTLRSMFGSLPFRPYDYIMIPRTTTYQIEFDSIDSPSDQGQMPIDLLIIEATGNIEIPKRYLNPDGQIRLGAPYCERDFHGPMQTDPIDLDTETPVVIQANGQRSRYVLANHPFDVVGWDGMVYP